MFREWSEYYSWLVGGVDLNLAGNGGGPECAGYRSTERKMGETLGMIILGVLLTAWSWKRIKKSITKTEEPLKHTHGWRQAWLVTYCIMFGILTGFKFASRQVVYILSPCHVVTALQIYILASPPSTFTQITFRVHLGLLNGAFLALMFPVLDTYLMPFEVEMFWVQHVLMLVLPVFLARQGGPYSPEPLHHIHHATLSYVIFFLYNFLVLQPVAVLTGINLNFVLCPAPTDPFAGPNYVFHACWTQVIVILGVSRLYSLILHKIKPEAKSEDKKKVE